MYPVLLINGYSTESFWLPTEPNDLVRTLLEKGHDTWILQPRFHPSNSSDCFTIEDIGRYDIPKGIFCKHNCTESNMRLCCKNFNYLNFVMCSD